MSFANTDWPMLRRVERVAFNESHFRQPTNAAERHGSYRLFASPSEALGDSTGEEEICFHRNKVVWWLEGAVKRQFTFHEDVKDVQWVFMPERCLCMVRPSRLSFYLPNEGLYDYPLYRADEMSHLWPLPYGILLQAESKFYYLRELYSEMKVIEFFNTAGEMALPGNVIWSSTEYPLLVSQKGAALHIWKLHFGVVDSITCLAPVTPAPKKSITRSVTASKAKFKAETLTRLQKGETPFASGFAFDPSTFDEELVQTPKPTQKKSDEKVTNPFFHFRPRLEFNCYDKNDVADSTCIAGGNMGRHIMIAIHCSNTHRAYYCSAETGELKHFRYEKHVDEVVSIAAINAFPKQFTKEHPYERYFISIDQNHRITIYQGVARIEDVNMELVLHGQLTTSLRATPSPGSLAPEGESSQSADCVVDPVGQCVTIGYCGKVERFRISLRPRDELATLCFFTIKEIDPSFYKTLTKDWIRGHLSVEATRTQDWIGFCRALHRALNIQFISPKENPITDPRKEAMPSTDADDAAGNILVGLHDLYENFKLDTTKWVLLKKMAHLLSSIAANLGAVLYLDYYARDVTPDVMLEAYGISLAVYMDVIYKSFKTKIKFTEPQNKQSALLDLMKPEKSSRRGKSQGATTTSRDNSRFAILKDVILILREHGRHTSRQATGNQYLICAKRVVELILSKGWDHAVIQSLPFGFALPIYEMLHALKESPPPGLPLSPFSRDEDVWIDLKVEGYVLIGREDISKTIGTRQRDTCDGKLKEPCLMRLEKAERRMCDQRYRSLSGPKLMSLGMAPAQSHVSRAAPVPVKQPLRDGMDDVMDALGSQRFSKDDRLHKVRHALNTTLPQDLGLDDGAETSDQMNKDIHPRLEAMCLCRLATPIGRGAFMLNTVTCSADDLHAAPEICLTGHVRGKTHPIRLSIPEGEVEDYGRTIGWSEFHQAVASALKMKPNVAYVRRFSDGIAEPMARSRARAGYCFAAGLQGQLEKKHIPEISKLLGTQHPLTLLSAVLGLSISHRGSQDKNLERMAFLHLPLYHPEHYPEVECCSPYVQTAMLLSIGFLRQQSNHYGSTKLMLDELGRHAGNKPQGGQSGLLYGGVSTDRESYGLAAGFAIGLINIGAGERLVGESQRRVILLLKSYFKGGRDPLLKPVGIAEQQTDPETLLGPGGLPWNEELFDKEMVAHIPFLNETVREEHLTRGLDGDQANGVASQSSVVSEGEYLDTDVTTPAATYALALMFLKTHNPAIADLFSVPTTEFGLQRIRYDFIMHCVLAKALVLWYDILPTESWIQSMLPKMMTDRDITYYFEKCEDYELHDIGKAHVHGVAGACLAIGLRYASSNNEAARVLLRDYLIRLLESKEKALDGFMKPTESYGLIDRSMTESVMSVIAVALALVMAGSGHQETFLLLDSLRKREKKGAKLREVNSDIGYGNYMAINMAIGFLFLGGGQQGFKTDNLSIAYLLLSVFPKFPLLPSDNQMHLQAFRHLYVLAAENRTLTAYDVDSAVSVLARICVQQRIPREKPTDLYETAAERDRDGDHFMAEAAPHMDCVVLEHEIGTPGLLPERHLVHALKVIGSRYHACTITGRGLDQLYETGKIYVKKHQWMLPYESDACGFELRTLAFLQLDVDQEDIYSNVVSMFQKHGVDSIFSAFAKALCSEERLKDPEMWDLVVFCRGVLSECVGQDKPEMLNVYLQLRNLYQRCIECMETPEPADGFEVARSPRYETEMTLWAVNFRAVLEFYASENAQRRFRRTEDSGTVAQPLIQPVFLKEIKEQLWKLFQSIGFVSTQSEPEEPSKLLYYYDKTFRGWPLAGRQEQLVFNSFLAVAEAHLSTHSGKPDRQSYCTEIAHLEY